MIKRYVLGARLWLIAGPSGKNRYYRLNLPLSVQNRHPITVIIEDEKARTLESTYRHAGNLRIIDGRSSIIF